GSLMDAPHTHRRAAAIFVGPCTGARGGDRFRRELPTGRRSRPISRGTSPPQVVKPQGAIGRSREIGSVPEPYAFVRPPMFLLRSAALHCARTSASGSETAYEQVQGTAATSAVGSEKRTEEACYKTNTKC